MTDKQENVLRMYYTVSAVCDANTEIWESNVVFSASYKKFSSKIPEIRKYNDLCRIENIASETLKSFDRIELEELAFYISGKLLTYTKNLVNNSLHNKILELKNNLHNTNESDIITSCNTITQIALLHVEELSKYDITAEDLAEFQQFITFYSSNLIRYQHNASKNKTTTDFLKKYIKEAREVLKENLDIEIAFFKNSDPDFYNLYKAAREVMQLETDAMPTFSGKLMDYAN